MEGSYRSCGRALLSPAENLRFVPSKFHNDIHFFLSPLSGLLPLPVGHRSLRPRPLDPTVGSQTLPLSTSAGRHARSFSQAPPTGSCWHLGLHLRRSWRRSRRDSRRQARHAALQAGQMITDALYPLLPNSVSVITEEPLAPLSFAIAGRCGWVSGGVRPSDRVGSTSESMFQDAAEQFRLDVAENPNDTEESIWCFLSEAQLYGVEEARKRFLEVGLDRRPVMRDAYALFKDGGDPEKLASNFSSSSDGELFYASLYAGLYYEAQKNAELAKSYIVAACKSPYGSRSGDYMAFLASVHCQQRNWNLEG